MATNETRNINLDFQTNAQEIKARVDALTSSLDNQSAEYQELTRAARALADAEFQLTNAQNALANSTDHTATAQQIMTRNLEAAQQNYTQTANNVNNLTTRISAGTVQQNRFTESVRTNGRAVLDNGGAVAILDSFTGGLATTIKDTVEAMGLFTTGSEAASTGVTLFGKSVRGALVASGIGLLVVAVGLLVTYWDDIKGLVSGVNGEMTKQNKLLDKNLKDEQKKLDTLNSQDNILKLQGKTEKEINDLKIKQTDEVIKQAEAQLKSLKLTKQLQVEAAERNKAILSGILKFLSLPITAITYAVDALGKALGKDFGLTKSFDSLANLVFDPKKVADEGQKAIDEADKALNELKNTRAGYILANRDIDQKAADERAKKQKEANDKALAEEKAYADKVLGIRKNLSKSTEDLLADTEQKRLDLARKREIDEIKSSVRSGAEQDELINKVYEKYKISQDKLNATRNTEAQKFVDDLIKADKKLEEYNEQKSVEAIEVLRKDKAAQLEIEREAAITKANELSANQTASAEQLLAIDTYYNELDKQNDEDAANAKTTITKLTQQQQIKGAADTFNAVGSLFAENTAAYKVNAVAQATMDTYASAVSSYNSLSGIPIVGPVLGAVAAGAAVAAGIINVKKILSVKTTKGGGSAGAGSAGGANGYGSTGGGSPQVSFVQSSENQLADTINRNQQTQAPIKAYVVSSEMTEQQSIDTKLSDQNTIG